MNRVLICKQKSKVESFLKKKIHLREFDDFSLLIGFHRLFIWVYL